MDYTTGGSNAVDGGEIVSNNKSPNDKEAENKMALTDDNTKVKFTNSNSFPVETSRNGDAKVEIESIQVAFAGMGKEELLKFANDPFWIRLRWLLFMLFWLMWLAMLVGAVVLIVLAPRCTPLPVLDWWQKSVIYHIYPPSFQDSNNDGFGDIKGIETRLDHVKYIGAKSVMLGPIYESPMIDNGYDVTNHILIGSKYGTMNDFENLIETLKAKDIKLIMDFIPNHTSNKSEWFINSVKKVENYTDYYVWENASADGGPPNNWLSVFGGSAWTLDKTRGQYYLHQFYPEQPDLNLRNPAVKEELKQILKFWLDKGVNGFRVDAIPHLYEDSQLQDEPQKDTGTENKNEYDSLDHIYTTNQDETFEILYEWREFLEQYEMANGGGHRLLIVEAIQPLNKTMLYYANGTQKLADFPLNFHFLKSLGKDSNGKSVEKNISSWLDAMPNSSWPNWVLGTHDDRRITSRVEPQLLDGLHMITMLIPGTPITYYGEEIGMLDIPLGDDEYQDKFKRDPARAPMQWNSTSNAGFSDASNKTWLPVHSNYTEVNVEAQKSDPRSHLNIYRNLVGLRTQPAIIFGSLDFLRISDEVLAFTRVKKGSPGYVILMNFGSNDTVVNLSSLTSVTKYNPEGVIKLSYSFPDRGLVEVSSANSPRKAKDNIFLNRVMLKPKEGLVINFVPSFT